MQVFCRFLSFLFFVSAIIFQFAKTKLCLLLQCDILFAVVRQPIHLFVVILHRQKERHITTTILLLHYLDPFDDITTTIVTTNNYYTTTILMYFGTTKNPASREAAGFLFSIPLVRVS